jgi:hypothetical protein
MEQRMIVLPFSPGPPGSIQVNEPPSSNLAPPGYYMLFLINQSGVPSIASFVQVSPSPSNLPPKGTITSPAGNLTISVGQSVVFAGSGSDPESGPLTYAWIFPDGTPDGSNVQNPGAIKFTEVGTHVVSLTVLDDAGANDPSPPTRTITVVPKSLKVTIVTPRQGATVNGRAKVKIDVSEQFGRANKFNLYLDGSLIDSRTVSGSSATFTWNTKRTGNSAHMLTATVQDAIGNTGTSPPRTVTVKN